MSELNADASTAPPPLPPPQGGDILVSASLPLSSPPPPPVQSSLPLQHPSIVVPNMGSGGSRRRGGSHSSPLNSRSGVFYGAPTFPVPVSPMPMVFMPQSQRAPNPQMSGMPRGGGRPSPQMSPTSAAVPVPGMLLAAPTSLDAVSSSTASASSVIAVAPAAPQQHVQHQSRTSQAAQGFNHPHFHAQQQHQHQQQQHLQAQMQFQMSMQRGRNFGQPQQFAPSGPMMMGVPPNFPFPYGGPMILPNLVSQPMPMSLMSGPVYLGAPPPSALGVANLSGALPSQVLNPISALPPAAGATSTSTLLTSAGIPPQDTLSSAGVSVVAPAAAPSVPLVKQRVKQALTITNPNTGQVIVPEKPISSTAPPTSAAGSVDSNSTEQLAALDVTQSAPTASRTSSSITYYSSAPVTQTMATGSIPSVLQPMAVQSARSSGVSSPSDLPSSESAVPNIVLAPTSLTGSSVALVQPSQPSQLVAAAAAAAAAVAISAHQPPTHAAVAAARLATKEPGLSMKEHVRLALLKKQLVSDGEMQPRSGTPAISASAVSSAPSSAMVTPSSSPGPYVDNSAAAKQEAVPPISLIAGESLSTVASSASSTVISPTVRTHVAIGTVAALEHQVNNVESGFFPSATAPTRLTSVTPPSLGSPAQSPPPQTSSRNSAGGSSVREDSISFAGDVVFDDDDAFETPVQSESDDSASDMGSDDDEANPQAALSHRWHYSHNELLKFQRGCMQAPDKDKWSFISGITCLLSSEDVIRAYNAKTLNISFGDSHRHSHRGSSSASQGRGLDFRNSAGRSSSGRQSSGGRQRSNSSASGGGGRQRSGSMHTAGQSRTSSFSGSVEDPNLPALVKSAARWQIGVAGGTAILGDVAKKIKGILNKITLEKFEKLSGDLMLLIKENISSMEQLTEVVDLIFDKALAEPAFGVIYADLCAMLNQNFPSIKKIEIGEDGQPLMENGAPVEKDVTFKKILLNKCQCEFEDSKIDIQESETRTAEEAEMMRTKAKARKRGNIKFIGELFKRSMIPERIIHVNCIQYLLTDIRNRSEEEFEALCQLLNSVGEQLDHERARSWMDSYFLRLENVNQGDALPARIKFMIQDVCENRAARWRKRQQSDGPKKLDTSNSQASASGNRGSAAGATLRSGDVRGLVSPSNNAARTSSSSASHSGRGSVRVAAPSSSATVPSASDIRAGRGSSASTSATASRSGGSGGRVSMASMIRTLPAAVSALPGTSIIAAGTVNPNSTSSDNSSLRTNRRTSINNSDSSEISFAPEPTIRSLGRGRSAPSQSSAQHVQLVTTSVVPETDNSLEVGFDTSLGGSSPFVGVQKEEDAEEFAIAMEASQISADVFEEIVEPAVEDDEEVVEKAKKKIGAMLRELWVSGDRGLTEAITCIRELPGAESPRVQALLVTDSILLSFEEHDSEQQLTGKMLARAVEEVAISRSATAEGLRAVYLQIEDQDLAVDYPQLPKYLGIICARLLCGGNVEFQILLTIVSELVSDARLREKLCGQVLKFFLNNQGLDPTQALIDSSKADLESLFFAPGADADSKQQVASKYELENCKF